MISENEATFLAGVGVEVHKHLETLKLYLLLDYFFRGPDCRVIHLLGGEIEAIQITGTRIESVVATRDTVWVEHHNHFEHIVLSEITPLLTFQVSKKF